MMASSADVPLPAFVLVVQEYSNADADTYGPGDTHLIGVFDTFASMCDAKDRSAVDELQLPNAEFKYAKVQRNACYKLGSLEWSSLVTPREESELSSRGEKWPPWRR